MKTNRYEFMDDYVIGYTNKHDNPFYFDTEDYELISQYSWKLDGYRNVVTKTPDGILSMHKLIMGDGIYIHDNGMNNDNRKTNIKPARGYKNQGKTIHNGYVAIYMPEHNRAFNNGCVYEHILVAEKILNRPLFPDEVVHHKDRNRTNNDENNLMVFQTDADHTRYHAGAEAIMLEDGSYISEYKNSGHRTMCTTNNGSNVTHAKFKNKTLCPLCNTRYKDITAKMCAECYKNKRIENIPSKEELEKLIGTMSMVKIGEVYGVSDNAVRKWCVKYDIPFSRKDLKYAM